MQPRLAAGKTTACLALLGRFWNAHVLFQGTPSILPLSVSLQTKAALCGRLFSFLSFLVSPALASTLAQLAALLRCHLTAAPALCGGWHPQKGISGVVFL